MMKYILLTIFVVVNLFAINSDEFTLRQERILLIKQVIQDEESIAKAYEQFLINELNRPASINDLINDNYLGSSFRPTFTGDNAILFNNYTITPNFHFINYRLRNALSSDANLRRLYESNTYRKHTFFYRDENNNDRIHIILENDFAKSLIPLLDDLGEAILDCNNIVKRRYCVEENQIFIYETNARNNLMILYHIDNFETGPIIINDDVAYHGRDEFINLTPGAKLIDFKNQNYLKTYDDIRKLQ